MYHIVSLKLTQLLEIITYLIMKKTLTIVLVIISGIVSAAECSCNEIYKWVRTTIEENDAGYHYVMKQKGVDSYNEHNANFEKIIDKADNTRDCVSILRNWLQFFRKGHLDIFIKNTAFNSPLDNDSTLFLDWEKIEITDSAFFEQLLISGDSNFVGVWKSDFYKIGVIKSKDEFVGFILEADGIFWKKFQVKLRITKDSDDGNFICTYYMRDHSEKIYSKVQILEKAYLQIGDIYFKRLAPYIPKNQILDNYVESMNATLPFFRSVNENTLLLRIPSFTFDQKAFIDSVLNEHQDLISSTRHLIIDIRNNGGGSDASYQKLLPYIYTNPYRHIGAAFLSTPLNNKKMKSYLEYPNLTDEEELWVRNNLKILNEGLGKFVNLDSSIVSEVKFDTVYTYPKKVSILINENNASTSEQFLLAAKQSQKVKLYGRTTAGILDFSNMNFVDCPCGDITLGYSTSKSFRIPDYPIDGIGIQPDFYLDKTLPDYLWVDYISDLE